MADSTNSISMATALAKLQESQVISKNTRMALVNSGIPAKAVPAQTASNKEAKTANTTRAKRRKDPSLITLPDLEKGDVVRYITDPDGRFGTVQNTPKLGQDITVTFAGGDANPEIQNWTAQKDYLLKTSNLILAQPAQSIGTTKVNFDSVILSDDKKDQIKAAIAQIDHHDLIFTTWGFSEVFEKGTAISMLFYGPPGTGKTLMAQAIADKYNQKLKIISTAEIQTPEPGGAERNLKEAFANASDGKTLLLFDECDGLITDRSRVGMILAAQINALLTGLETYQGVAIFTTNRLEALDPAFDRRLSLKLEFPMPDAKHREQIWKRMFPKRCPLSPDIRWADLASIEIAGGHIKNVVLKAARLAAMTKATMITDDILWECLEKEVESLEAYTGAIDSYNPWYGNAIKGGVGASLVRRPSGRHEVSRSE